MKIGLLGCGCIGRIISQAIEKGDIPKTRIICVYDKNKVKCESFVENLRQKPNILGDFTEFTKYNLDLVVETASQKAVREYIPQILQNRIDVLIMSVGALLDDKLLDKILNTCKKHNVNVYVPSGAIVGLDGVKAASMGEIKEVCLHSIKPKKSLKGNKYLEEKGIDVESVSEELVIFDGVAREAVKAFPKSVNVCAALSLVGIGADKTLVRISLDPAAERIRHRITVKGDFGELNTVVSNITSPQNPKTSYLAALSAIKTLKKLSGEHLQIGT